MRQKRRAAAGKSAMPVSTFLLRTHCHSGGALAEVEKFPAAETKTNAHDYLEYICTGSAPHFFRVEKKVAKKPPVRELPAVKYLLGICILFR